VHTDAFPWSPGIKPQPFENLGGPARHPRRLDEALFSRLGLEGEPGTAVSSSFRWRANYPQKGISLSPELLRFEPSRPPHNTPDSSCGIWEFTPKESRELRRCQAHYPAVWPNYDPAVTTQTSS